jgi:cytochrome c peroxidase
VSNDRGLRGDACNPKRGRSAGLRRGIQSANFSSSIPFSASLPSSFLEPSNCPSAPLRVAYLPQKPIVNQGLNGIAHFGNYQPGVVRDASRYDDQQLYALALYTYSLRPPANPHPAKNQTRRGAKVFEREGCAACHPAPLYTNNKLTLAKGFRVPPQLRKVDAILDISVGTNAGLAMETRRGTDFYKVPSLRGLWLRSLYGHEGAAASLDEWLIHPVCVRTTSPRATTMVRVRLKAMSLGLRLNSDEKSALIAFLRTL